MRIHQVRIIDYERNAAGREVAYTKRAAIDLDEIEYMEADRIDSLGDCVIVRLRSGKELTVYMTIQQLWDVL